MSWTCLYLYGFAVIEDVQCAFNSTCRETCLDDIFLIFYQIQVEYSSVDCRI